MEFKEFIYYNTDFINSFVAQANDGIVHKTQLESGKNITELDGQSVTTSSPSVAANLGLYNLFNGTINVGGNSAQEINISKTSDFAKEITQKIMDDNVFVNMMNNINCKNDHDNLKYNDFVLINQNIKFLDLIDYAEIIGGGFIELNNRFSMLEFEKAESTLNRQQRRNSKHMEEKKKIESKLDKEADDIKFLYNMLMFMDKVFPSSVFLKADGFFIPVEKKYFRVPQKTIPYKYKNPTTLLGRVVGTIDKADDFDFTQGTLRDLSKSISDLRREAFNLFDIESDSQIIMPIAWYSTYEIELNQ